MASVATEENRKYSRFSLMRAINAGNFALHRETRQNAKKKYWVETALAGYFRAEEFFEFFFQANFEITYHSL